MNIVFDLGGVVFTWRPDELIRKYFNDYESQKIVKQEIFSHHDWVELDRGTLNLNDAIERGALRTGISRSKINDLMQQIPHSLKPIIETVHLVQSLKENGHNIFILSNMHMASIEYLEHNYSFLNIFDGRVISCRIQMVKPEPEIYMHLLNNFGLIANDTIFIDDTDENLDAATQFGIKPIKFENADKCKSDLQKNGYL
jgi:putative hydrolase of the HAD superfamily